MKRNIEATRFISLSRYLAIRDIKMHAPDADGVVYEAYNPVTHGWAELIVVADSDLRAETIWEYVS